MMPFQGTHAPKKAEKAELKSGGGDDMTTISNLESATAATKTATNNTSGIFAELRTLHTEQMKEMAALVAASTAINTNAPPLREGKAQIYMNPDGTRRVRYPPPRGVNTTVVGSKVMAVRTCGNCTKNWLTHTDAEFLELAMNKGNRRAGWTSYFM